MKRTEIVPTTIAVRTLPCPRWTGRPLRLPTHVCRSRGVALVIALSFIVLVTFLVVAFLSTVSTEVTSTRAVSSESAAAQLAASAVQLVQGTITYATEPRTSTAVAWACQPGMIRTYGSGNDPAFTASSNPLAYYKLYSSNNMIVNGSPACNQFTDPNQANSLYKEVPQYWDSAPSLFADLNAPLVTSSGTTIFPIVDPRAADLGVEGFASSATSATLDGTITAAGQTAASGTVGNTGAPNSYSADSQARLPMPVRWMYVLRDGTMTVPDGPAVPTNSTKSLSATWSNAVPANLLPTSANPIVGRVAFWTDDECGKLNVNTASEGTYWDTLITNSGNSPVPIPISNPPPLPNPAPDYTQPIGDIPLGVIQPAQHEYQRYPGHPATTCLSTVFGNALSAYNAQTRGQLVQAITAAVPRITDLVSPTATSGTSSMGGTQLPQPGTSVPSAPLLTDFDRLYASLDEFQFAPTNRQAAQTLGSSGNATSLQNDIDSCRFFLTASSKAPELNLFGLPRVAMWPVWNSANAAKNTDFDKEMLRCSTFAMNTDAHQMIFQRAYPTSAFLDWTSIARNQQIYGYLQQLTSRPVPGFGGTFGTASGKYRTSNMDQILTEMFDYVRCTNLADNSVSASGQVATPYTGTLGPTPLSPGVAPNVGNQGFVMPITITSTDGTITHGMGRIPTVAELGLVLMKVDDRKSTSQPETASNLATTILVRNASPATVNPQTTTLVEWALVPKLASPMQGYVALPNNLRLHFKTVTLKIGSTTVSSPFPDMHDSSLNASGTRVGRMSAWRDCVVGGIMGTTGLIESSGSYGAQAAPTDSAYPTGLVAVPGTSKSLGLSSAATTTVSGQVVMELYAPDTGTVSGTPLQTFTFNFNTSGGAAAPVPIPNLYYSTSPYTSPDPPYNTIAPTNAWYGAFRSGPSNYTAGATAIFTWPASNLTKNGSRLNGTLYDYFGGVDSTTHLGTDVVRSVVPNGILNGTAVAGDLRDVAMSQNNVQTATVTPVPATTYSLAFARDPTTHLAVAPSNTTYGACSLRSGLLFTAPGWSQGALSSAIPITSYSTEPEVPTQDPTSPSPLGVPFPGDWDNGTGLMPDGPWANKPDEGTALTTAVPYIGSYESFESYAGQTPTLFSPNRQISSPVMFGSLPAGWLAATSTGPAQPWRTLLFRPATLLSTSNPHPGGSDATIRDHLLLDLFWMPVVEPYGISEPFATSGKVNLNTQIAPFTYITRTTGLRGVLKSVMVTALNPTMNSDGSGSKFASNYKQPYNAQNAYGYHINGQATTRYPIDRDQTISQIITQPASFTAIPAPADTTTNNAYPEFGRTSHTAALPNFFVSASQICDLPLVPQGTQASGVQAFWQQNTLTGDNSLERPYSMIYPRVTTKSNIFTVHVLAQSLKKIATDPSQAVWNENKDQVLGEFRGSYTIEKYYDPNNDDITSDSAGQSTCPASSDGTISATAGLRSTKWRLLGAKRFGQ